ncbi:MULTISPECIES: hypothetical protein [Bacillus]|uniref:hypothetical protein n=1 Tax=Bacillus TaxID=1386 RepID=UPI0022824855|nr:hypothetical protein [Bacillus haynesii]MCY8549410.1 hypothetical protein [Bacillus haynesii]
MKRIISKIKERKGIHNQRLDHEIRIELLKWFIEELENKLNILLKEMDNHLKILREYRVNQTEDQAALSTHLEEHKNLNIEFRETFSLRNSLKDELKAIKEELL